MEKKMISTDKAPGAIGPYSQAIQAGNFVFISGQIPIDPSSNQLVQESFAQQCHQVMRNLQGVLEAAKSSLEKLVKVNVYLKNMNNFAEFNTIYGEYVGESKPARACVEVSRLPKDVDVEIEAVALAGS